jgi:putative transposase
MSRSASGSLEEPGRNVRAKSGLNKAILDQGWGEWRRQLDYKSGWQGGWLVAVPPANTSRECPVCGHISAYNRKSQSVFLCVACGHTENADLVAAKNIRGRGLKLPKGQDIGRIVCEVNGAVRPSAAGTRRSEQAADAA